MQRFIGNTKDNASTRLRHPSPQADREAEVSAIRAGDEALTIDKDSIMFQSMCDLRAYSSSR